MNSGLQRRAVAQALLQTADLVARGEFLSAQSIVERELEKVRGTSMTVAAVEAYIWFMLGQTEECRAKVGQARLLASNGEEPSLFVQDYCDMLEAMMAGDAERFNSVALRLRDCKNQHIPKSVLFVPDPLPEGWLDPTLQ